MEEDSFDREQNDDDSELDSGDEAAAYSKVSFFSRCTLYRSCRSVCVLQSVEQRGYVSLVSAFFSLMHTAPFL